MPESMLSCFFVTEMDQLHFLQVMKSTESHYIILVLGATSEQS